MKKTKGFLIICQGHPMYGEMAYNLAVTIKASGNTFPICIVYNSSAISHLDEAQMNLFEDKIYMDELFITIRTKLPEITPYDYTLQLDADLLWLKKDAGELFKILDRTDFTVENYGYTLDGIVTKGQQDYTHWARYEDICAAYPIQGKLYKCCNSFILFKKTEKVAELFKLWSEINANPKCKFIEWSETCPDEFGLNVALNLLKKEPHKSSWQLGKWLIGDTTYSSPAKHAAEFFAINAAGNRKNRREIEYYNLLAKAACDKLTLKFMFPLKQKRDYIKERAKM